MTQKATARPIKTSREILAETINCFPQVLMDDGVAEFKISHILEAMNEYAMQLTDDIRAEYYESQIQMRDRINEALRKEVSDLSAEPPYLSDEEIWMEANSTKPQTWSQGANLDSAYIHGIINGMKRFRDKYCNGVKEGGWISVEERLPEGRVNTVLAFNGDAPEYNQHIFVTRYFEQEKKFHDLGSYMGTITHWQPLPSPPTSVKEKTNE